MHADEKKRRQCIQMKRKEAMHTAEKKRRIGMQMKRKEKMHAEKENKEFREIVRIWSDGFEWPAGRRHFII